MSDEQSKLHDEEQDEDLKVEDLEVKEGADKVRGGLNPQPLPPEPPHEGRRL
jgi:hypothetical protein